MKAAAIYENGGPEVLRYIDVPEPECPEGFVVVDTEAISIEGGDLLHRGGGELPAVPHIVGYLNAGTIKWQIPFGEYPKLAAQGITNTGTDNYGGAIVTENGMLLIAATTYDNTFHAYDKRTGKLLWSAKLPFAGNATPSTYMVNGRQYIVIACGGGKNGAPSGGTYVAFALPNDR